MTSLGTSLGAAMGNAGPTSMTIMRSAFEDAVPQAVGQVVLALFLVFLTVSVGFMIAAYSEQVSRRVRPATATMRRPRTQGTPPVLVMVALLTCIVLASRIMGIEF